MTKNLKSFGWWLGLGLAFFVSFTASYSADWLGLKIFGFEKSPISAIMVAIFIGILIANLINLPKNIEPGLKFCSSIILRLGIMLLGIRLSLIGAGQYALIALPFVVVTILIGLFSIGFIGRHLGLPKQLCGLIAVGSSICGCSAIAATAPLINANDSEVSYSVTCITVFGLFAMFVYPIIANQVFTAQPELAGLFLGTSIHETAQVTGAAMMYEAQYNAPLALDVATVTKLVRNLCMLFLIPLVGILFSSNSSFHAKGKINYLTIIPWFIVGFALMSALRTIGDMSDMPFGLIDSSHWNEMVIFIKNTAEQFLLLAMAAVGLTTTLNGVIKIGIAPFILGLFSAVLIGSVSIVIINLFASDLINIFFL